MNVVPGGAFFCDMEHIFAKGRNSRTAHDMSLLSPSPLSNPSGNKILITASNSRPIPASNGISRVC